MITLEINLIDMILGYSIVWYDMVLYGVVWFGMVWYGMVWYGMVWYGMVLHLRGHLLKKILLQICCIFCQAQFQLASLAELSLVLILVIT